MLKFQAQVITLADGESPVPRRIQVIRTGNFSSEQYGKFKVTREHLASFVKNFQENARGYPDKRLPIDYFHENDKLAAGWIDDLELAEDGESLFAQVTWTPKAEKHLADRELRYVSAEFSFDYVSNEGGKKFGPTLFGAGLTNRPFIKGMDAVVELSEGEPQMTLEEAQKKITDLESQIADQTKTIGDLKANEKKLADEKAAADKKLAEEKATSEKKGQFDKMLGEGKVCEAQREAFMSGDTIKFAELAQPVKLGAQGSGQGAGEGGEKSAQDEIMEKAEKLMGEKKLSLSEAMQSVQRENPALAERYRKEVAVR